MTGVAPAMWLNNIMNGLTLRNHLSKHLDFTSRSAQDTIPSQQRDQFPAPVKDQL